MKRILVVGALVLVSACTGGSVDANPPVAMDVGDAIYFVATNTGDPGADGALVVLLSDRSDLCSYVADGAFEGAWELLGLQAFTGSSDVPADVGTYPVGTVGRRADVSRLFADNGCRAPTQVATASAGTLEITQGPGDGKVEGTFSGHVGDQDVSAEFTARRCDEAASVLNGFVSRLRFRSCE